MQISLAAFRPKSALKSRRLADCRRGRGGVKRKFLPLRCSNFAAVFMNFRIVATAIRETVLSPDLSPSIVTYRAKKRAKQKKIENFNPRCYYTRTQ